MFVNKKINFLNSIILNSFYEFLTLIQLLQNILFLIFCLSYFFSELKRARALMENL